MSDCLEDRPYIAFFQGKRKEIWAKSQWDAVQKARSELKVPKSKQGLLSVVLADVTHSTGSL
mgnify:CR=1 FL=1